MKRLFVTNIMSKKSQKWLRLDHENGWQSVVPDFDIKPHGFPQGKKKAELEAENCPCKPKINFKSQIIIHNSFQDIERIEKSLKTLTL